MIGYSYKTTGCVLPQINGYMLLSALAAKFPSLHGREDLQVAPLRGTRRMDNAIYLDQSSYIHLRGISEQERDALANSWIILNGQIVGLGPAIPVPILPHPKLVSRQVVLKDCYDPEDFRIRLQEMLPENVQITHIGKRRFFPIHGVNKPSFPVVLEGLDVPTSIFLQENGVGKLTSMGCGVFYGRR